MTASGVELANGDRCEDGIDLKRETIRSLRDLSRAVDSDLETAFADPTSTDVLGLADASAALHRALLALEAIMV
ncbi:MAG: hypothetical protein M0Z30_21675 [Actinomycetota bacterium]|nr:hypothetical protein [Actinomycetota bacterium]